MLNVLAIMGRLVADPELRTTQSGTNVCSFRIACDRNFARHPKSWAPFKAMEKRTQLYREGDKAGIDQLEQELLAQNAQHKDWTCSEEMMKLTKDGKALYMHCLPADISGLSCEEGEVDNSVFDRYIEPLYKEASFKPYIIAAMIFLSKVKDPVGALRALEARGEKRKAF